MKIITICMGIILSAVAVASYISVPNVSRAQLNFSGHGYYPNAAPSTYYILPGNKLSFYGHGFAPNEIVTISTGIYRVVYRADAGGNLFLPNIFMVGYNKASSTQVFTMRGTDSGYSMRYRVVVGNYYPNIFPSSYFVSQGEAMSVFGNGFAPFEPVTLSFDGENMSMTSDGSGSVDFIINAPNAAGNYVVTATGDWSNTESSRTIKVAE